MIFQLLTLIFLLGIFLVVKKVQNPNGNLDSKQNLPPGPWGLPLLGHLAFLGLNIHLTLLKWKEKYGSIIHLRFGSFPAVVLFDSKLIKEAFSLTEFSGRPLIQVIQETKADKGILLSEGPYNSELRHFTTRKLKEFGMGRKSLEGQIHTGIVEFMDFIKISEGRPIKSENVPSAHIIRTLWSIMMTDKLDPGKIEHFYHLGLAVEQPGPILSELAGLMPWMEKIARTISFGRFSLISKRAKQVREMLSFVLNVLQERKIDGRKGQGQGQYSAPADIMELFLEKTAKTSNKSSPFHASQNAPAYFLADIFLAGIHTVYTTLLWMLSYAARNREVQLKLQEEIDLVIGPSRLPSLADRGQMPYADAFVHELLRMSSVAPLSLPHKTTADVCFQGYKIKKNTMIFAHTYGIHHDPEIWGDPENFRPQRWFGDSGKKLKSEHFFPFGTGRRICVAEALARDQLFLYVTTLFQKYNVSFPMGKVPEVKGVFAISLHPTKFAVEFHQRKMQ